MTDADYVLLLTRHREDVGAPNSHLIFDVLAYSKNKVIFRNEMGLDPM